MPDIQSSALAPSPSRYQAAPEEEHTTRAHGEKSGLKPSGNPRGREGVLLRVHLRACFDPPVLDEAGQQAPALAHLERDAKALAHLL